MVNLQPLPIGDGLHAYTLIDQACVDPANAIDDVY